MLKQFSLSAFSLCVLSFSQANASSILYQLPKIEAVAKPPFSYQASSQLGNQVIISHSQIIRSGTTSVEQLLNSIAGIQFISGVGAEPEILIHSEPALILVDGQDLTNFSMTAPDVGLIPLSEIEQVIITPGVTGAEYGNASLGGVINIITKPANEKDRHISLLFGTPLMTQINIGQAGPLRPNYAYRVNVQSLYQQGYRASDQQTNNQLVLKLSHETKINSLNVTLTGLNQTVHYPGYLTDSQIAQDPTQSIAGQGQGDQESHTVMSIISWRHRLDSVWYSNTQLSYRERQANSNLAGLFSQSYQTLKLSPELDGDLHIGKQSLPIKVGLMLSNETYQFLSPVFSTAVINHANQQQYAAYGSLDLPLTKTLSFSLGGRVVSINTQAQFVNYATNFTDPPSAQAQQLGLLTLSLSKQFNKETAGYIRRAMGYQLPFIDESNYTANPNTGFGLKATTSTAYEMGINWHNQVWQTDAEIFAISLHNEIGYYVPAGNIWGANYNLPPTHREGLTFDAQFEPSLKWTLGTSATLMDNRFRSGSYDGNEIPGASELLAKFSLTYQFTTIWSIYAESQYVGPQYAQGDNANITAAVPSYCLFNLALIAALPSWNVSFRIDNLSNVQYNLASVYDNYITAPHSNDIAYYPAPGRTAMLQIAYKLN